MIFDDRCGVLSKIFGTNQTAGTITLPAFLSQEPIGDGFYPLNPISGSGPKRALIFPFGTAAANKTFTMEIFVWRQTRPHPTDPNIRTCWLPYPVAAFTCTTGAMVGLAGCYVDNTQFMCDTIVAAGTVGVAGVDYNIRTPADDTAASVDVAVYGASVLGILFGVGTSEAVDANALVATL